MNGIDVILKEQPELSKVVVNIYVPFSLVIYSGFTFQKQHNSRTNAPAAEKPNQGLKNWSNERKDMK